MTAPLYQIPVHSIDGRPASLKDYEGSVMLIVNVASACGLTPQYEGLEKIYEKYHDRGLEIVGVDLDNDGDALAKFLKDNDLPWTILHNSEPKKTEDEKPGFTDPNAEQYGITGIPTIILIDRKGKVISLDARGEQLATLVDGLVGGDGTLRR